MSSKLFQSIVMLVFSSVGVCGEHVLSKKTHVYDVLATIVQIPLEGGIVSAGPFDPTRVTKAIRRLDKFTTQEISQAIDEYWLTFPH